MVNEREDANQLSEEDVDKSTSQVSQRRGRGIVDWEIYFFGASPLVASPITAR